MPVSDAKYFMMCGWARFIDLKQNDDLMSQIIRRRAKGNWAILVEKDYWALQYQRYHFRKFRASRAVGHGKMRSYRFTGMGPLTSTLFGIAIPGWETDPETVAVKADYERMHEKRLKAVQACKALRAMPEPYNVREELGRLDHEDACREAMGY